MRAQTCWSNHLASTGSLTNHFLLSFFCKEHLFWGSRKLSFDISRLFSCWAHWVNISIHSQSSSWPPDKFKLSLPFPFLSPLSVSTDSWRKIFGCFLATFTPARLPFDICVGILRVFLYSCCLPACPSLASEVDERGETWTTTVNLRLGKTDAEWHSQTHTLTVCGQLQACAINLRGFIIASDSSYKCSRDPVIIGIALRWYFSTI